MFTRALEIILIEYKYRHALLKIIYLIEWTEEREKEIIIEKCKSFVLTKKKKEICFTFKNTHPLRKVYFLIWHDVAAASA